MGKCNRISKEQQPALWGSAVAPECPTMKARRVEPQPWFAVEKMSWKLFPSKGREEKVRKK